MAVQTGLGEPRGPWFISPELDPDGRARWDVPGSDRDPGRRRRHGPLLAALAGFGNAFRMVRLPEPVQSGEGDATLVG